MDILVGVHARIHPYSTDYNDGLRYFQLAAEVAVDPETETGLQTD